MWFYEWGDFEVRIIKIKEGEFKVSVYDRLFKGMFRPTLEGLPPRYMLNFPKTGIRMDSVGELVETIDEYKRLLPILEDKLKELTTTN